MIARTVQPVAEALQGAEGRIWRVAAPSMLANMSGALIGIVDIWVVGHLGSEASLAGLAVGAFFMTNLYVLFSFLYMSTVGLVSQSVGMGRRRRLVEVIARALVVAAAAGCLLVLVAPLVRDLTIDLWGPTAAAADAAHAYLSIRLIGAPAIFMTLCIKGFLIGIQRARIVLLLDLTLNVINVAATLTLVLLLDLGVAGAAVGNLIAETVAAVIALILLARFVRPPRVAAMMRRAGFWHLSGFREQASINGFLFVRTLFIQGVFALLSVSGARLGDDVLAGNHLLLQILFVETLIFAGMSSATQTLVGAAAGAGNRILFGFWSMRTTAWSFGIGVVMAVAGLVLGRTAVSAFTDVEAVRSVAHHQIHLIALWPLLSFLSFQMDGIFIGATHPRPMLWSAGTAAAVFVVAQSVLIPALANRGLWLAFLLFFVVRGAMLSAFYVGLARRIGEPGRR